MDKFNVIVHLESGYALLSDRNRQAWCKRVADRKAREWKADNLRDAFIEPEFGTNETARAARGL